MYKLQIIDKKLLDTVTNQAQISGRKRMNHNFHSSYADPINRMLNAVEPGTYCRPHKHEHPDKREVFLLLRGKVAVYFFDNNGIIENIVELSAKSGIYGVDIPPRMWHTIVSLEPCSVVYEVKDGPYSKPDDKDFAPWAPAETDAGADGYLEKLIKAHAKP